MKDLVSIIMPSYNTGKYILESVNSVINQTYTNWELIIVDDCSNDNTLCVLKSLNDSRIRIIVNDENSGAAFSRNRALQNANGRWIAFLDSDDIWSPLKLEKMLDFMTKNNYSFAYHNYEKIDENSLPMNIYVSGPNIVTKRKLYHYDYIGCLTFMYDRKIHGLIQIENIKKNNDYAILLKLIRNADCFLLNENLGKYRIRNNSISHDKITKKIKSHYELFRKCDKKTPYSALWLACWNMWYGLLKKIKYEKNRK